MYRTIVIDVFPSRKRYVSIPILEWSRWKGEVGREGAVLVAGSSRWKTSIESQQPGAPLGVAAPVSAVSEHETGTKCAVSRIRVASRLSSTYFNWSRTQ